MESRSLVTRTHVRIASAILTAVGLAYTYYALQLPLGDPIGTGVGATPSAIGLLWVIFGCFVTLRTPDIQVRDDEVGTWPSLAMTKRLALAVALCFGFVVTQPLLGMIVTSGLFLILMAQLSGAPWGKSLLASIVLPVFFWLVFVKLLQVSLPAGSLFAYLFGS
ncbi:MAG: tripartite tricarboxylate transporter TctB family protein [Afipia sp.]